MRYFKVSLSDTELCNEFRKKQMRYIIVAHYNTILCYIMGTLNILMYRDIFKDFEVLIKIFLWNNSANASQSNCFMCCSQKAFQIVLSNYLTRWKVKNDLIGNFIGSDHSCLEFFYRAIVGWNRLWVTFGIRDKGW